MSLKMRNFDGEMRTHIFLVGFMGCGKSTLGAALADELGMPFVDLDDYIEERCQATITTIYNTVGETRFRDIERQALNEVAHSSEAAIVACGGGTPCAEGNMELMNARGLTIWLTTSAERIASRLCLPEHKNKRPLIAQLDDKQVLEYITSSLEQREPYYALAQLRFDSTDIETADETRITAQKLASLLREFFGNQ